jgi:hypothetical protein
VVLIKSDVAPRFCCSIAGLFGVVQRLCCLGDALITACIAVHRWGCSRVVLLFGGVRLLKEDIAYGHCCPRAVLLAGRVDQEGGCSKVVLFTGCVAKGWCCLREGLLKGGIGAARRWGF